MAAMRTSSCAVEPLSARGEIWLRRHDPPRPGSIVLAESPAWLGSTRPRAGRSLWIRKAHGPRANRRQSEPCRRREAARPGADLSAPRARIAPRRCVEDSLFRDVGSADHIVDPDGLRLLSLALILFRAEDTPLSHLRANGLRARDKNDRREFAACSPPMRPRATAAAEATWSSSSAETPHQAAPPTSTSPRTPIELITPTSRLPCNRSSA